MAHSVSRSDNVFAFISEVKGSGYASRTVRSSKLKADGSLGANLVREILLEEGGVGSGYGGTHVVVGFDVVIGLCSSLDLGSVNHKPPQATRNIFGNLSRRLGAGPAAGSGTLPLTPPPDYAPTFPLLISLLHSVFCSCTRRVHPGT